MSTNEIFTKGHNDNKSRIFRIKTVWEDGYFQLFVVDGTNSWFALVTKDQIKELAEQHELDVEVYFKNLKEYFNSEDNSSITFDVTKKQFLMYRKVKTENFRVKYFLTNLEKVTYQETVETIIDELVLKQKEILRRLEIAEEQKLNFESQKALYQQKCEEFVEMKQKADHKVYSAFTLLLNEKKHRIQFLTELLEEYKNDGKSKFGTLSSTPSLNQSKKQNKGIKTKKTQVKASDSIPSTSQVSKKLECVSESESSGGYDTDEEKKLKVHSEDKNTTVCISSKDDLDFLGDSSPPPSLPKRTKRNKDANTIGSLLDSPPKREIKGVVCKNETKEESMDIQQDNSDNETQPNTQDLWERM